LIASRALLRSVAVVRFRIWLATALASGAIAGSLLPAAQVDDEENGRRDESGQTASSPNPKKSPSPVAKASSGKSRKKRRASETLENAPTAIPHAKLANEESETETDSSPKEKKSPTPIPKAKAVSKESAGDEESPDAQESPRARKPKSAEKSDEEEAPREATPRETPERGAGSQKSKRRRTPTPKPKTAKKRSREKETSRKTKKAAKAKPAQEEEETPKPVKTPVSQAEEETSTSSPPRAVAAPTPAPTPQGKVPRAAPAGERAQVVIEKSGLEEEQGYEPPPSPPPRRGFWPWSRRSGNYRYLTRSVIEAIRRAPVKRRRWQFIVVHNSGTRQGNARVFDYYHRRVRRMQNGLAYHFVVGNGTSTGNGQVEVGDRWRRQINGGHVHSDYLNNISLGICLVGDFNRDQPTRAQLDACDELIRYLRERCGKVGWRDIPVRPHREMNPPRWATDCPGDDFPYSWFRRF
jgi:N-acetylmuramoyl-L-alanine amidase